jgi:type II secretion system protein H
MALRHQKKNGLTFGMNKKSGFSLLEIMIVLMLIGIIGSIITPNLQRSTPRYEREEFIARFNALTQLAWQQALMKHQLYQVSVDIGKRAIFLSQPTGTVDRSGNPVFKPAQDVVQNTSFVIPEQFDIKQFFIEGFDMMAKFTKSKTEEVWFYVVPGGMTQDVVVNFVDNKDLYNNAPRQVGLVLNPFSAQFKVYDTFQKP